LAPPTVAGCARRVVRTRTSSSNVKSPGGTASNNGFVLDRGDAIHPASGQIRASRAWTR